MKNEKLPLSLIAFVVLLGLVIWPPVSWPEVLGLAVALLVHYARELIPEKRDVTPATRDDLDKLAKTVSELQTKVNGLSIAQGMRGVGERR